MYPDYMDNENRYKTDLSWVEKPNFEGHDEPSIQQLLDDSSWKTDRWVADLLRDETYIPSADLVKANLVLAAIENKNVRDHEEVDDQSELRELGVNITETTEHQRELMGTYDESLSSYRKSPSYNENETVLREEKHPVFPHGIYDLDDVTARMMLLHGLCERISGTPQGADVAEWMIDHIDYFEKASDPEEMTKFLYDMTHAAGRPNRENASYYHKLSQMLASKITIEVEGETPFEDRIQYTAPNGTVIDMDFYDDWNISRVMYGFGEDLRNDTIDGLLFTISGMPEGEERNKLLSMLFAQQGPAYLLNNMRQIINDEDLFPEDRRNAAQLFRTFYEGVVRTEDNQLIPPDIKHFYTIVADNEAFMTEEKEGEKHHELIKSALQEAGISPDDLVIEAACGKGWLTDRLRNDGFHIVGSDLNPALLERARERFPESEFHLASWDDMSSIPHAENAKAFIINGRSVHHLKQFDGFHAMMKEMENAELIVFDAANPETGAQKDRLDAFRQSLENFGYSKEWLDKYMWQGVGSHDGVVLGDRWYPPKEWWVNMMGMHGFEMQIIKEPNYDGRGTENMVMISRPVKDQELRKELIKKSNQFFRGLHDNQPANSNGSGMYDWQNLRHR